MLDFGVILSNLSDPLTLLLMMGSASFGIIMGAIPGLSGTLGIALLLPFTFSVEPHQALLMLGSVYCGSEYGGSIPAILINTPGTAAALCTTFDGAEQFPAVLETPAGTFSTGELAGSVGLPDGMVAARPA